ncbi:hypothetical protein [Actinomadura opuntiae]|uniref:hypothetical protein n=1 Tax=Actinomadura sp. OS1-43 TaxID=604315 RepID=UPI00255AA424|nr:hypothetical protein [Actinomadura sp. OS1-43]MDL4818606.1 hypothetical protein [Actinomadura sp. OS1-43]
MWWHEVTGRQSAEHERLPPGVAESAVVGAADVTTLTDSSVMDLTQCGLSAAFGEG